MAKGDGADQGAAEVNDRSRFRHSSSSGADVGDNPPYQNAWPSESAAPKLRFPKRQVIGVDGSVAVCVALRLGCTSRQAVASLPSQEVGSIGVAIGVEVRCQHNGRNDRIPEDEILRACRVEG